MVYLTNEGSSESRLYITMDGKGGCEEKTLEGFDFSFNPKLNAKLALDPWNDSFIEKKEHVLLYGSSGVERSYIAQVLGYKEGFVIFSEQGSLRPFREICSYI